MHVTRRMRLPVATAFCISLINQWLKQMAGKGLFWFILFKHGYITLNIGSP